MAMILYLKIHGIVSLVRNEYTDPSSISGRDCWNYIYSTNTLWKDLNPTILLPAMDW